ncbi:MAG: hypothetical protein ACI8ZW_001892, partial [Yoonia sp.]
MNEKERRTLTLLLPYQSQAEEINEHFAVKVEVAIEILRSRSQSGWLRNSQTLIQRSGHRRHLERRIKTETEKSAMM